MQVSVNWFICAKTMIKINVHVFDMQDASNSAEPDYGSPACQSSDHSLMKDGVDGEGCFKNIYAQVCFN